MTDIERLKKIRDTAIEILDNIQMAHNPSLNRTTTLKLLDEREILTDELKKLFDDI